MNAAKHGDTVKIHFRGALEDGQEVGNSRDQDPLEFTIGKGMVIKGIEDAVTGMKVGDNKTVVVEPDRGFGEYQPENTVTLPVSQLPENISPELGMTLQIMTDSGQPALVRIVELSEEQVTLDGNHPLAGLTVSFDIEMLDIVGA